MQLQERHDRKKNLESMISIYQNVLNNIINQLDHVRAVVEKYSLHHEFTSQAFRLEGGLGVALLTSKERYSPKAGGGAGWEQSVKGVVVLRRADDGSWIATYLIWNRDAPPPHGEIQPQVATLMRQEQWERVTASAR